MPIPDYQSIMLPFLLYANDAKEHSSRDAINSLSEQFGLTDEDRKELLPSGKQAVFDNRIGWARTYLKKAVLIESKKRGFFNITARGQKVLAENPEKINVKYLERFPEFVEFRTVKKKDKKTGNNGSVPDDEKNPEEVLEAAYQELQDTLASELKDIIEKCSPEFFERLVIDVLVKMGYGGSRKEAGQAIGKSGDEGIDGIIKEDKLGLDIIYIQAKRWQATVGRPEIQKFAGALLGQQAKKGIFITTSSYSSGSKVYVKNLDSKIILIDGDQLAELMIENNVGVNVSASYEIKKIDSDYFIEA
jgi:restriction system protein